MPLASTRIVLQRGERPPAFRAGVPPQTLGSNHRFTGVVELCQDNGRGSRWLLSKLDTPAIIQKASNENN
jgi:hypothetical protein